MRYRIAVLSSSFSYSFHPLLLQGIAAAAKEHDFDVVCISCGSYDTPDKEVQMRNILYNFINPDMFDGFLIPYSSLGQYSGYPEFKEFIKPILKKPCVLLGAEEPEFACINTDFSNGFYLLINHLINEHQCTAIAFLRGPKFHNTSNFREAGIRRAFKELGIDEDRLFIYSRNTNIEEARKVADEIIQSKLYKKHRLALICNGDGTALEVMFRFQENGIVIPDDFIICGSSGSPESLLSKPSLTTIDQNVAGLGYKAANDLYQQLKTGYKPGITYCDVVNFYRESCGCKPEEGKNESSLTDNKMYNSVSEKTNLPAYLHFFRLFGYKVISDFDLSELFNLMKTRLGIKNCYLSLYNSPAPLFEYSKMLQALRNGQQLIVGNEDFQFKTSEIIPKAMLPEERSTLLVEPLFYQGEQLGLLTMEVGDHNGLVYEAISAQLAGAIKSKIQLEELKAAEERFFEMAQSSSDWLWEIDKNYAITFSSGGFEQILQFDSKEIIGSDFFKYLFPKDENLQNNLKNEIFLKKQPIHNYELTISRDGGKLYLELSGKPIIDNADNIIGFRGVCKDVTFEKLNKEKHIQMAFHDQLTGLPNRRLIIDRMEMLIKNYKRDKAKFGIFYIDLDNFKSINDAMGHDKGDQLLIQIANVIPSSTREGDTLARVGGDEFVLLFPRVYDHESAEIIANRVINCFINKISHDKGFQEVTTSIGIALFPEHGESVEEILKNADTAMYKAKTKGKNCYCFFNS